jgi:uncharacterized protein (DUF2336 family)
MPPQVNISSKPPANTSPLILSEQDVVRLLNEETPDVRIDVLKKVSEGHNAYQYSLKELAIAEQIFRLLVKDTEIAVREALSFALKDNPHVPHDIIMSLARDIDAVGMPVIECSPVLTDGDLVALIQSSRKSGKPAAAASRKHISDAVTQALLESQNAYAMSQLLKNPGAEITDNSYLEMMRAYGSDKDVMGALAERPGLPITVVEKIITLVSDSIADTLRVRYNISAATIVHETEKTREVATLKLVDGKINTQEVEKLVDQLQVFGRLTPSIILTSLCRGNLYFFETALARLSNIPVKNAQLLIHDKGGLGFKALYAKAGLPDKFFTASKYLLEVVADMQRNKEHPAKYADALAQKLITKSSGKPVDNMSYILALIRQSA